MVVMIILDSQKINYANISIEAETSPLDPGIILDSQSLKELNKYTLIKLHRQLSYTSTK